MRPARLSALHSLDDHVQCLVNRNAQLLVATTRWNLPGQARASFTTTERAPMKLWPARRADASNGSCRKLFGEKLALPLELLLQTEPYSERYYEGEDHREEK